jgi:FkbM family methyltransferase
MDSPFSRRLTSMPRALLRGALDLYRLLPKRPMMTVEGLSLRHPIPRSGVLHLGANDGGEAESYARCGFQRVVWVEGFPEFYALLVERLRAYPNQTAYNVLISDVENEELSFQIADNRVSSTTFGVGSRFHEDFPGIQFDQRRVLRARRLDRFFEEEGVDLADFSIVVIDLEGAELKALRSIGEALGKVPYVMIEVSVTENFIGGPLLHDIDAYMVEQGFRRVELKLGSSSGDALYQRRAPGVLDRLSMAASAAYLEHLHYPLYRDGVVKALKRLAGLPSDQAPAAH